jgi:hypothetical protein
MGAKAKEATPRQSEPSYGELHDDKKERRGQDLNLQFLAEPVFKTGALPGYATSAKGHLHIATSWNAFIASGAKASISPVEALRYE